MRRRRQRRSVVPLLSLLAVLCVACQGTPTATPERGSGLTATPPAVASPRASERPRPVITTQVSGEGISGGSTASIAWPKVTGLTFEADQPIQAAIDSLIRARLDAFEVRSATGAITLTGTFDAPYSGTDFLSLRFTFVETGLDDGRPQAATLNFECSTGRRLELREMFADRDAAVRTLSEESFRGISEQLAGKIPAAHGPGDPSSVFYPAWVSFADWTIDPAGVRLGFAYRDVMWRDGTGYLFAIVPWSALQKAIDPVGPLGEFVTGSRRSLSPAPTVAPTPTPPPFPAATNLPARLTTAGADPGAIWRGVTFTRAADYGAQQVGLADMAFKTLARWPGGWLISDEAIPNESSIPSVVFLSVDGETWQAVPAPGACFPSPQGIVSFNAAGNVWTSPDGRNWTFHVTTGPTGSVIAAGSGGLLAVIAPAGLAYSRDGISWQPVSLPTVDGYQVSPRAAAWTGSRFLMAGVAGGSTSDVVLWSRDGLQWNVAPTPVPTGEGSFIVGRGGVMLVNLWTVPQVALRSADGVEWRDVSGLLPRDPRSKGWPEIYSNGERMLARAAGGLLWTSFDGLTWTRLAGSAPLSTGSDNVRGGVSLMPRGIFYDDWKRSYVAYGAAW